MGRVSAIFIDMDGVLCNFVKSVAHAFNRSGVEYDAMLRDWPKGEWSVHKALALEEESEVWDVIDRVGAPFWGSLEAYPWARSLWDVCRSIAPTYIASSPSRDQDSAKGKVAWIKSWLGSDFRDYIITPRKHLLAGDREGRVLIDDFDVNVKRWAEEGGHPILFPQPWNSSNDEDIDPNPDPLPSVISDLMYYHLGR